MAEPALDTVKRYLDIYLGWGVNLHCPVCGCEEERQLDLSPHRCDGRYVTVRRGTCKACRSIWDEMHGLDCLFDATPHTTDRQWFHFIQTGLKLCPWGCNSKITWDEPIWDDYYSLSGVCPECLKELHMLYQIKDIEIVSCAPCTETVNLFED